MAALFWLITVLGYAVFLAMAAVVAWAAATGGIVLTERTAEFWIAIVAAASAASLFFLGKVTDQLMASLQRRQRIKDFVTALHAEISISLESVSLQTAEGESDYLRHQELPFGPSDKTDFVYYSIQQDLTLMPIDVIYEIVRYYKLAAQTNFLTDDLKHPLYTKQKRSEKQKYAKNLLDIMLEQEEAGRSALTKLEEYIPKLAYKRQAGN